MLKITWFESVDELEKLTGLTRSALWDAGFNLDDMDFGIRVNRRIHRLPTKDEVADGEFGEDELVEDWDLEGYWLLSRMQSHCCGAEYVKYGRYHYYMVYHA